jgi:hypothetical protein
MEVVTTDPAVPEDTLELRLQIARVHAGVRSGLSRGLTASEAGALVGVAGQTWRSWETGATTNAARRPAMLDKIAKELGVNLDWLRDGGPLRPQA